MKERFLWGGLVVQSLWGRGGLVPRVFERWFTQAHDFRFREYRSYLTPALGFGLHHKMWHFRSVERSKDAIASVIFHKAVTTRHWEMAISRTTENYHTTVMLFGNSYRLYIRYVAYTEAPGLTYKIWKHYSTNCYVKPYEIRTISLQYY